MTTDDRIYLDPEILGPEEEREAKVKAGLWPSLKRAARAIPFSSDVLSAYYCAMDPATPRRVRYTLVGALAYFVVPTDILPDFLPFVGFTDDATVLMTVIGMLGTHIEPRHREAADKALETGTV